MVCCFTTVLFPLFHNYRVEQHRDTVGGSACDLHPFHNYSPTSEREGVYIQHDWIQHPCHVVSVQRPTLSSFFNPRRLMSAGQCCRPLLLLCPYLHIVQCMAAQYIPSCDFCCVAIPTSQDRSIGFLSIPSIRLQTFGYRNCCPFFPTLLSLRSFIYCYSVHVRVYMYCTYLYSFMTTSSHSLCPHCPL